MSRSLRIEYPGAFYHVTAHGLDLRKLHIIPNGISPDDWQVEDQPIGGDLAAYVQTVHNRGHFLVGYAGTHGMPNALDALLDAAQVLKEEPIRFVLVGDGHEKARLLQRVTDEGLDNVRLFAPIPKAQIPALLREIDVAYIGWKRIPIYRFGIAPNKLLDYMMAGRAILHSVEAGNNPVAEAACGLTVPPESPKAIADGLLKLVGLSLAERNVMGLNGRAYVQTRHTYPVLAQKFLMIMKGEV